MAQVKAKVEQIRRVRGDDEMAHGMEDELWADVLHAIAEGTEDAASLASEALKTADIQFARWCA